MRMCLVDWPEKNSSVIIQLNRNRLLIFKERFHHSRIQIEIIQVLQMENVFLLFFCFDSEEFKFKTKLDPGQSSKI